VTHRAFLGNQRDHVAAKIHRRPEFGRRAALRGGFHRAATCQLVGVILHPRGSRCSPGLGGSAPRSIHNSAAPRRSRRAIAADRSVRRYLDVERSARHNRLRCPSASAAFRSTRARALVLFHDREFAEDPPRASCRISGAESVLPATRRGSAFRGIPSITRLAGFSRDIQFGSSDPTCRHPGSRVCRADP